MNNYLTLKIRKEFLSLKSKKNTIKTKTASLEKKECAARQFTLTFSTKTGENFIRDQN